MPNAIGLALLGYGAIFAVFVLLALAAFVLEEIADHRHGPGEVVDLAQARRLRQQERDAQRTLYPPLARETWPALPIDPRDVA